jgi:hypothetical protein
MEKAYHSKDAESNETSWAFRSQRGMKYHPPPTPPIKGGELERMFHQQKRIKTGKSLLDRQVHSGC